MDEVQIMAGNVSARATSLYYASVSFFLFILTLLNTFWRVRSEEKKKLHKFDRRLVKYNAGRWLNSDIIFELFFLVGFTSSFFSSGTLSSI